ncbi:putative NAC domain-containing protein 94 isoform X1 [Pyrus x bretschneideri]|uniref:putative NAC domain-containing protein 94 isoform X1 n=1 Tax=Pyrus x bretschneideri TaxID=225117 RepID=UPI00202FC3C8|nr:putative NAC domain-containing protein 94 isoform X1 [Pyrus x bretschneideri]XP_048421869.1 putative NAC domain-containing protein 94 isoform X1 [Pyrus x bretschneideri]
MLLEYSEVSYKLLCSCTFISVQTSLAQTQREKKHMGTQGSNRKTGGVSDAVGVRFNPTPEEMVDHYLKLKKQDKGFKSDHIAEFDVCNLDPWDLAARIPSDDMVWYFFSPKEYKYINSTRYNRTTPGGQWKMTGKERPVKARLSKAVIGKKRTLTFYQRCGPQRKLKKTNWVRHEYSLIDSEANSNPKLRQKDFVLNRMKKEFDEEDTSIGEVELGSYSVSNVEDHAAAAVTPESQDYSSSTFLSSGYIEPGDVLQANGTNYDCNAIQSPFGDNHYSYIDKNDISNYDKGDLFTMSDFENELLDDMCQEPRVGDFYSHFTYKNNISANAENEAVSYTAYDFKNQNADDMIQEQSYLQPEKHARSVLDADVCNSGYNNWQPQFWNKDSYLTDKNNISTNNECEQFSNTHFNFEN